MKKIKDIKKVFIADYSNYDAEKCFNGGKYAFYATFERTGEKEFTAIYSTTSDFPYCTVYGRFEDCKNCNEYIDNEGCIADQTIKEWFVEDKIDCAKIAILAGKDVKLEIDGERWRDDDDN